MIAAVVALALAQAPSTAAARPPAPVIVTPSAIDPVRSLGRLSPGGRAALNAEMKAERTRMRADVRRARAAHLAVRRASLRRPLDLAALRAAMEARDALQYDMRRSRTRSAIAFLERLSPADRALVAGAVAGSLGRDLTTRGSTPGR